MRFSVTSVERPKSIARAIQRALKTTAQARSYSQCLELVARLYGYRSWRELEASLGTTPPSPPDHACSAEERAARRAFQEGVLREAGFSPDVARPLLDAVAPTSGKAETGAPQTAAELAPAPASVVRTKLVNALHWLSQNAHNVRLITPPKDVPGEFILAWEIPRDFPYQPCTITAGCYYVRLRTRFRDEGNDGTPRTVSPYGIAVGRFIGKVPTGFIDFDDPARPIGNDFSDLSGVLVRMGYATPLKDHGLRKLSASMTRFIDAIDCEALHALRAKRAIGVEDYMALLLIHDDHTGLFEMISTAPVLASLVTMSSRPHWPIGLNIEIREAEDPESALAIALADDVCSIDSLRNAIRRCRGWSPRITQCDGMTEQGLRLLALCAETDVPSQPDEIEALLDLGYLLQHRPGIDSRTIARIVEQHRGCSWTSMLSSTFQSELIEEQAA